MGNGSVPWLFHINMSTFPSARSTLVTGLHLFLWLGRSCSHRFFSNVFPEAQVRGKMSLYSCSEKATGMSQRWDREPDVRHSRQREQQQPRTGIPQPCKAGDTAVCRSWGGALQIMPHSTFACLAMFLALLFKNIYQKKGETAGNC